MIEPQQATNAGTKQSSDQDEVGELDLGLILGPFWDFTL